MEENKNQDHLAGDEIDLVEVAKRIWAYRATLIVISGLFLLLGIMVAVMSEKEFKAYSTFIPQAGDANRMGGNLSGLASLAGINLGGISAGSDIPPTLYPKIVSSVNFKKELLQAEIQTEGGERVSYAQYYEEIFQPGALSNIKRYTIGLPGEILKLRKGTSAVSPVDSGDNSLIMVSEEEMKHFDRLDKQITIQHNERQGTVELGFNMPEPLMAAQMAKFAEALLQKEVIAYKIQNAREQLKFTEERYMEKKNEFQTIQNQLASFRDRNQNISSAIALNQLNRMEADYNFSFTIYTELAKQLEQAKLQVSKDTPIFMIIEPVTLPTRRAAPNRPLIVIMFTLVGIMIAFTFVFGRIFYLSLKKQWIK